MPDQLLAFRQNALCYNNLRRRVVASQKAWILAQLIGTRFPTFSCMKMELPDIRGDDRTPLVESLLAIIRIQQDRIQQLEATVQELRDEIAILKGQKPRPDIKPSRLEASQPKPTPPAGSKRPGSAKRPKTDELHIDHEVPLHPEGPPVGATFKGFEPYVVQELLIKNDNTRYLRAR